MDINLGSMRATCNAYPIPRDLLILTTVDEECMYCSSYEIQLQNGRMEIQDLLACK